MERTVFGYYVRAQGCSRVDEPDAWCLSTWCLCVSMHAVEWAVRPYPARVGGGTRCTAGFPIRARAPPACVHRSPGAVGRTLAWRWPSTHDLHSNNVSPVSLLLSGSIPTTSDSGPRACVGSGSFALLSCFVSRDSLLLLLFSHSSFGPSTAKCEARFEHSAGPHLLTCILMDASFPCHAVRTCLALEFSFVFLLAQN